MHLRHTLGSVLVLSVFTLLIACGVSRSQGEEPYHIFLKDKLGAGWGLGVVKSQWSFYSLRLRPPEKNDTVGDRIAKSRELFFVEPAEGGVRFRREADRDLFGGYLAADYSTDPPSVIINFAAIEGTLWIVHKDKQGLNYVENVNETGKKMWLSMESKGTVYPALNEEDKVYEYRHAILSADEKHEIKLSQRASGK